MADTFTTNFNITKPEAGKINWDTDYAALCDLIDSRLAMHVRNLIINGGFDIWQRGTSFAAIAAGLYTADRFEFYRSGFALGASFSRQSSSGIVSSEYVGRLQRDSGDTATDALFLSSALESRDSVLYAGENMVLSVKLRKGANYSGGDVSFKIVNGTGVDEGLGGTNFTGHNELAAGLATLSTSFQTFQVTGAVPSNSTQLGIVISYTPTGTAGADDWIEIAEVQLEEGSVATNFERRLLGLEQSLCRRYFVRRRAEAGYTDFAIGHCHSTTTMRVVIFFGAELRTLPTFSTSGNLRVVAAAGSIPVTSISQNSLEFAKSNVLVTANVASGLIAGQGAEFGANNDANAYLDFDAEL